MAATEPKRPPPPKSYVPLTFLDGPPALPPRPRAQSGASSIPPRPAPHPPTSTYHPPSYAAPPPPTSPTSPATQPEGGGSESPVPVKPVRRKTKKGAAQPPPLTARPTATDVPNTENNMNGREKSGSPDYEEPFAQPEYQVPNIQPRRRQTLPKPREKPPMPAPYGGQSPHLNRPTHVPPSPKREEKDQRLTNHSPALPTPRSRPVPPRPMQGEDRERGNEGEKEKHKPKEVERDKERGKPPAPVRPTTEGSQQQAPAKQPVVKPHRPPPSRPARPPTANTPPPESSHPVDPPLKPRPRTASASIGSTVGSPKPGRLPNIQKRGSEIVGINADSGDTISPPSISPSHSHPSTSHSLARRMTAPSRPSAPPRKHPGLPPPRKSTLPPQRPPPNQGNESPNSSTPPVTEKVEQQTEIQDINNQHSPRNSPPRPQRPLREQPSKIELENSQKGKRLPPPRPGSHPSSPSPGKIAPPRPAQQPSSIKGAEQKQQQEDDELGKKILELGPPPTEEPPEPPSEILEEHSPAEPLVLSPNEQGLPLHPTKQLSTPQSQPPPSSQATPPSPTPRTPHSPSAPRNPPRRPTQPPPPRQTASSKQTQEGEEQKKTVERVEEKEKTAMAVQEVSPEPNGSGDKLKNQMDAVKQETPTTKPMRPAQRPPPPRVAQQKQNEGTELPPGETLAKAEALAGFSPGRPPIRKKLSPSPPPSTEIRPSESVKKTHDKPPLAKKPSVPITTPSPPPIIAPAEIEKEPDKPGQSSPPIQKATLPPEATLPKEEDLKPDRPLLLKQPSIKAKSSPEAMPKQEDENPSRPPPSKVTTSNETENDKVEKPDETEKQADPVKHQVPTTKQMRPAQRPPPPRVAQQKQNEGAELPPGETLAKAEALASVSPGRPPIRQKPSPSPPPSTEIRPSESVKKTHDKPPLARKPITTPSPSPVIAPAEIEKEPDKPGRSSPPVQKATPPPEAAMLKEEDVKPDRPPPLKRPSIKAKPSPEATMPKQEDKKPSRPPATTSNETEVEKPDETEKQADPVKQVPTTKPMRPAQRPPPPRVTRRKQNEGAELPPGEKQPVTLPAENEEQAEIPDQPKQPSPQLKKATTTRTHTSVRPSVRVSVAPSIGLSSFLPSILPFVHTSVHTSVHTPSVHTTIPINPKVENPERQADTVMQEEPTTRPKRPAQRPPPPKQKQNEEGADIPPEEEPPVTAQVETEQAEKPDKPKQPSLQPKKAKPVPIHASIRPSIGVSMRPSFVPSILPSVHPSVHTSVHTSIPIHPHSSAPEATMPKEEVKPQRPAPVKQPSIKSSPSPKATRSKETESKKAEKPSRPPPVKRPSSGNKSTPASTLKEAEDDKPEQVDKSPNEERPSKNGTPAPEATMSTEEEEKTESSSPHLKNATPPPEAVILKQMEDERTETLPPVKEPLMKSTPAPVVTSNKTEDEKPRKPSQPPTVKRPSPPQKKSTLPPCTTTLQQTGNDKPVEKTDKPPPAKTTPVSAAQDYNEEDRMTQQRSSPTSPQEKPTPHLGATSEENIPAQVEKPDEDKEDRATQLHKPEQLEMPEKVSTGVPHREQRKLERREREGGEEVEMIRVIRTEEGVTEQIVSGSSGGGDQVEGGGREREEEHADDFPTAVVKLRQKPHPPSDVSPGTARTKPPRPVSMPPGRLPAPKLTPSSQKQGKPARPPSLIIEQPGRPPRPSAPPPRPSQRPPARKITPTGGAHTPPHDPSVPPPLPPRPGPGHALYRYVCSEPHGLAITVHEATASDELSYQEGDVIELIERLDDQWFLARNANNNMQEGLILARDLKIVKRLPGQDTVAGFEEGPCAVATHDFQGEGADELSFKAGDLIMLKSRVSSEWLRGKLLNGAEGIFPNSFVEIVEDLPEGVMETPSQPTAAETTVEIRGPHCVAVYPFTAEGEGELSLTAGDTIELLEKVGAEWLKGKRGEDTGIFPSQFVEIKVDLPSSDVKSPGPSTGPTDVVTATYDFTGQEGELSFKTGDKIRVTAQVNEEWLRGELGSQSGIFPASFIDAVPPNLPPDDSSKRATSPTASTKSDTAKVTGKCEALFEFTGEGSGELSFSQGETIVTTEWVNDEWLMGKIGDREGMFPASFVKIITELPKSSAGKVSSPTPKVTKVTDDLMPKGVALYDYNAGSDQEISFKTGDVLYLLDKVGNKWYLGENTRTGQIGEFPTNYVNVTVPLP